jgi:hypothetical protein
VSPGRIGIVNRAKIDRGQLGVDTRVIRANMPDTGYTDAQSFFRRSLVHKYLFLRQHSSSFASKAAKGPRPSTHSTATTGQRQTPRRGPFLCLSFSGGLRNRLAVRKSESRLQVQKTYKLYIGGKFVRGENGRVIAARDKSGEVIANFSRSSKKDFRDAVLAARNALPNWSKNSAYLRSQILYRAAEMLEMRRNELQNELARMNGTSDSAAERETTAAIDRLVYYAGWTDKFSQVFGSVNPVASSHFNFTTPEPTGVVIAICPEEPALLGLVSMIAPIILSGNCVIALASPANALAALTFTEVIATSDLPGGVVNVLAGDRAELAPHFASHMDVNAIVDASGDDKISRELQRGGDYNVKRYFRRNLSSGQWMGAEAENPYWILDTVEMKTAWHPIGL